MRTLAFALVLISVLVAIAGTAAGAAEAVPLALKFAAGDQMSYDATFSGMGSVTAPDGQTSSLSLQGSGTLSQRVVRTNPDGSAVVELLLPAAEVTVSLGGRQARFSYANGKIRWSADGKEQSPPQADLSAAPLLKLPVTVTMYPDGRMGGVSLPGGQFLDMLRQALPGAEPALPKMSSAPIFPDHAVKVGESWEQPLPIPAGPLAAGLSGKSRRTLDQMMGGPGMELAKISGFTEVSYRPTQSTGIPIGESLSVSVPELRQTVRSTEFVNISAGRLVRADYDLNFTTKVAATMGSQAQTGSIDARFRIVVTTR